MRNILHRAQGAPCSGCKPCKSWLEEENQAFMFRFEHFRNPMFPAKLMGGKKNLTKKTR